MPGKITKDRIAGMNLHYRHYTFDYFLDSMVKLEINNVEIWGASPHLHVNEATSGEIKEVKRKIEDRGLNVICFTPEQCVYPINAAAKEDRLRQSSVDYFLASLDIAAELQAPLMLVTSGWGYLDEPHGDAWARSRQSLATLAQRAGQLGITLVLEPLRQEESNLVNDIQSLKEMLEQVNSPFLKGMIDTIPMAILGEELDSYFETFGQDILHIHFVDGKPRGHLAWGDGVLPLEQYLKSLDRHNYQGYLTLEITESLYLLEPEKAVQQSLAKLASHLGTP